MEYQRLSTNDETGRRGVDVTMGLADLRSLREFVEAFEPAPGTLGVAMKNGLVEDLAEIEERVEEEW